MDRNVEAGELGLATMAAVDGLLSSLEGERLYAICLQTADDGMSVTACANTEEGFSAKRASEAECEEMTPEYEAYLRWAPAEWRYEGFGDAEFTAINRDLTDAAIGGPAEGFGPYFSHLTDAMIDALVDLRAERAQELADVTLFVTVSDSDSNSAETIERRSATRLNSPAVAEAFDRRFR